MLLSRTLPIAALVALASSCAAPPSKQIATSDSSWDPSWRSRYSWMWPKRSATDSLEFVLHALHTLRAHPDGVHAALDLPPRADLFSRLPGPQSVMLVSVPPGSDLGGLDYWLCQSALVTNDSRLLDTLILGLAEHASLDFVFDIHVREGADGLTVSLALKRVLIVDGAVTYEWVRETVSLYIFEYNGEPVVVYSGRWVD